MKRANEMGHEIISKLKNTYNQLGYDNLERLADIYTDDIVFIDPFHRVESLDALTSHFENMYQNLMTIHFDYIDEISNENSSLITWQMDYSHRAIKKGQIISVSGATHLKFDTKIYFHQDYFDTSAMIFEHIPIIGTILGWIRKRI